MAKEPTYPQTKHTRGVDEELQKAPAIGGKMELEKPTTPLQEDSVKFNTAKPENGVGFQTHDYSGGKRRKSDDKETPGKQRKSEHEDMPADDPDAYGEEVQHHTPTDLDGDPV